MFYNEEYVSKVIANNPMQTLIKEETNSNVYKRNNSTYVDICPFCGDRQSMYVTNDSYYCHACGHGGNSAEFIMNLHNTTFAEAIQYLATKRKMQVSDVDEQKPLLISAKSKTIMEINAIAARFYFTQLRSDDGKIGISYLNSRDVPEKIRSSFGLGYAGGFGDKLYQLLKSKGYSETAIMDSGLVSKSSKTGAKNPFYDKFWDRVVFPIFDADGQVIAFGGRALDNVKVKEGQNAPPKYLNSPETAAFTKGNHLFCYDKAKKSKHKYFICCEGYMDAMSMHQYGFDNAVASLGTALTRQQIQLLSTKDEVILAYDSDSAGINATKRAITLCREAGVPVRILQVTGAKDPDEFLKKFGAAAFGKLIKNAEDAKHFMIRNSRTADGKIDFDSAVEELF